MKTLCLKIILLILLPFLSIGQNWPRCGFLEAQDFLLDQDPSAKHRIERALKGFEENSGESYINQQSIYTIPVVFHILHLGGPENISDAQIMNALDILNRDFNKQNDDTSDIVAAFQSVASDCQIEFKLAQVDENGNCTTGITRHYDPNTNWNLSPSNYKYTWNRTRYLNIYVVKSLPSGIGAYTFLPGTASAGMDAVVILHGLVGEIGTSQAFGSRSLTHEVGHWLNLQHTWGNTNQPGQTCGDDGVGDTPVTKGFSFCNLANADVCTPGTEENVQNFMEYAFCPNMFTLGQRNRMHNALNSANAGRINLWSPGNLQYTGVFNTPIPCPPKADFASPRQFACVGDSVGFDDYSYGGTILNWSWTSPSAANSATQANGKLLFNQSGTATVQLKVSSQAGSDSLSRKALIILPASGSGSAALTQGFEMSTFPDAIWLRSDPEYGSAFSQHTNAAKSGTSGIWVNNFFDTPSEPVSFFSPAYKFQSFSPITLSFYYAYAQKASASDDELSVYVSNNCGQNWTSVFERKGSALATVTGLANMTFFPAPNQYSLATVDLSEYYDQDFHLKFTFSPDPLGPGNNLFIDDIQLSGLTSWKENLAPVKWTCFPNPNQGVLTIHSPGHVETVDLRLLDFGGRVLMEKNNFKPSTPLELPPSLQNGLYLLEIQSASFRDRLKLVLSK